MAPPPVSSMDMITTPDPAAASASASASAPAEDRSIPSLGGGGGVIRAPPGDAAPHNSMASQNGALGASMASLGASHANSAHRSGVGADSCANLVVDIGANHGKGVVLIRGRESHTSDLGAFDRYVDRLREGAGRRGEEVRDHEEEDSDDEDDDGDGGCDGGCDGEGKAGICEPFWAHVRSILSEAEQPVGFTELPDPDAVVPKARSDVDRFLTKAVGLLSVNPINPAALAQECGVSHEDALTELLYATKVGLVSMRWAPECERCGSAACDSDDLGALPSEANCAGCLYPNKIDSLDEIKVLFQLTPDVLYVLADNYACTPSKESMDATALFAAVPATSTGSGFRYSVGCGGDDAQLRPALDPGTYRMRCPVARTDNLLRVEGSANETDRPVTLRMRVSDVLRTDPSDSQRELSVPHGRIHFDVLPDTRSFFVLWVQHNLDEDTLMHLPHDERAPYTRATDLLHCRAFQRLFSDQVVSSHPESLLRIERVVLVFTDVVGSTNLYASLGDGPALRLVRKHYQVLFQSFTRRGRVVKTVGDAVMASFTTGRTAIEACAEALRRVPRVCILPDGSPLQIRIGIHAGSAVVVPLNGVNDYFGQTVNIAARVEAAAKASECFITEAVLGSDPDAMDAYWELVSGDGGGASGASVDGCGGGSGSGGGCNGASAAGGRGSTSSRQHHRSRFEPTPETELNLKGVSEPVRARGIRLRSRVRRGSDVSFGAAPTRVFRRSQLFERRDVEAAAASVASSAGGHDHDAGLQDDDSIGGNSGVSGTSGGGGGGGGGGGAVVGARRRRSRRLSAMSQLSNDAIDEEAMEAILRLGEPGDGG